MRLDFKKFDVLRGYYYLVPLWLILESVALPGVRAGLVAGDSTAGRFAFYAAEAAIGGSFWLGWRWAGLAAFLENAGYLILACRFLLIRPMEIALQAETLDIGPAADRYARAVPGVALSLALVVVQIYRQGYLAGSGD